MTDNSIEKKWIAKFRHGFDVKKYNFTDEIKVNEIYNHVYHGMTCTASNNCLSKLIESNIIESYSVDEKVYVQVLDDKELLTKSEIQASMKKAIVTEEITTQSTDAFISRIGANHSSQISGNGSGSISNRTDINVFVFDTGIATHSDLNIVNGRNFTSADINAWQDFNGHGTHVSGIIGAFDNKIGIVGVAPGVRLWAIKVLGNDGSGSTSNIISALNWVLSNRNLLWSGYGVINMSFGGPPNLALESSINTVINSGIPVCVAAGNGTTNASSISPARINNAITVGATSLNPTYNILAPYSNYGSIVDIQAPGTSIYSTYLNGGYASMSGTSMATPVITGTIAIMISTVKLGTATTLGFVGNVKNTLLYVSTPISYPNYDASITLNQRIILTPIALTSNTTDISVRAGSY